MEIREADLRDSDHAAALVEIVDSYARGPGGQGAPLSRHARENLVAVVRAHPASTVWMAFVDERSVGVAVCVETYSTFAGRPVMNIHDLAVLPEHRGNGIGRALLAAVERHARSLGCCKITLEVLDTNDGAKRLYAAVGFGPWDATTLFVTKPL